MKPAHSFRMHESESWGQVQQCVKEGGGRRQDGGIEMKGGNGKERRGVKANGFVATVIIGLAENHFISHRAEGMLGKWNEAGFFLCFEAVTQADVFISCILTMKGNESKAGWTLCDLLLQTWLALYV